MSCVQVAPPVHINNNVVVTPPSGYHVPLKFYYIIYLNLHSHDLRVPVGSLSRSGFIQEAAHQIREHSRVFEDYFREHFENIYMMKFRR